MTRPVSAIAARARFLKLLPAALLLSLCACAVVERVGVGVLSDRAPLTEAQITRNVAYVQGAGAHPRHTLTFYSPTGRDWPVIVFVHGGGWDSGDKDLRVGGLDVYGNIGRFYATQGIGVAVINYRLQPDAQWNEQAEDVARAVAWTYNNVESLGGDRRRLFVMGHSAGGYFASLVALNQGLQEQAGLPPGAIRGLICVAGAALDLMDPETYKTEDPRYYEIRFGPRSDGRTWTRASPATHVDETDPPALFLYGDKESPGLKLQSERLAALLVGVGVPSTVVRLPKENHARMVLALTAPKKAAVPAVLDFIETK